MLQILKTPKIAKGNRTKTKTKIIKITTITSMQPSIIIPTAAVALPALLLPPSLLEGELEEEVEIHRTLKDKGVGEVEA